MTTIDYGKLNPWVKRAWVRALRSGEYRQGRGDLIENVWDDETKTTGGYCCLGVVAAECSPEFLTDPADDGFAGGAILVRGEHPYRGTIPDDLATMWGLTEEAQDKLVDMNDNGGGFKRIATWIERNL